MKQFSIMKPTLLTLLFAASLTLARADVEDVLNQAYEVSAGGQLVLDVDRGSIEVTAKAGDRCEIQVTRKAKKQKALDDHKVTFARDGQKITVAATSKSASSSWWGGDSCDVAYQITVPEKFDLELKTAGGSIHVAGVTGKIKTHTSGGSMKYEKLSGSLDANTSGGAISVANFNGPVQLRTSGGSLKLANITGDVNAKTSGGSITVSELTGKTVIHTSGGSISATAIKGQIEAMTSGGSILAEVAGQPTGDCSFKTSGGSVSVTLASKAAINLDAQTSAGRVTSDFEVSPPQNPKHKSELVGKINAGGPNITIRTSAGGIHIKSSGAN